jgi:Circularly permutated YpsA SLOG family
LLERIVSGGQTGVDRGALDAALALDFPCGGWCPAGRLAEDGPIPERYPVVELAGGDYRARTRKNVQDSDGTLILAFGAPAGGTLETLRDCLRFRKPHLVVDASTASADAAAGRALLFVQENAIRVLNVAGPRETGWKGAHAYAEASVRGLLALGRYARSM